MFSADNDNVKYGGIIFQVFKILGVFDATIRKTHDLSAYLPISFDEFQGFTISATYHSALLDFKFETQFTKDQQT